MFISNWNPSYGTKELFNLPPLVGAFAPGYFCMVHVGVSEQAQLIL